MSFWQKHDVENRVLSILEDMPGNEPWPEGRMGGWRHDQLKPISFDCPTRHDGDY